MVLTSYETTMELGHPISLRLNWRGIQKLAPSVESGCSLKNGAITPKSGPQSCFISILFGNVERRVHIYVFWTERDYEIQLYRSYIIVTSMYFILLCVQTMSKPKRFLTNASQYCV